jgi:hypothetical protein
VSTIAPPPAAAASRPAPRQGFLARLNAPRSDVALRRDAWLAVAVGIVMRVAQYAWNRSLFIDEAALALNIRERGYLELTQTLDHAQAAPLGFLFLQKTLWHVLGDNPYVLRLPSLIAGIAALVLFVFLARRFLPKHLVPAAVALMAVSESAIFWGTDTKEYAIGLLGTLILLLLALRFIDKPDRRNALALGAAGAVLPWFALAPVIVMTGIGAVLLVVLRRHVIALLSVFGLWLLAAPSAFHMATTLSPEDAAYFRADWWDGFLPLPFAEGWVAAWWRAVVNNFYDPLGFGYPVPTFIAMAVALAGTLWLIRKAPLPATLLLATLCATMVFSMAGAYPVTGRWAYSGRVGLFLLPAAYLSIAAGAAWIRTRGASISLAFVPVALVGAASLIDLPYSRGEVEDVLGYVAQSARDTDQVYLYYGIRLAERYYEPRIPGIITRGTCSHDDPSRYQEEMDRLGRHSRVWVVLGHDFYGEHELIQRYLSGWPVISARNERVASAKLYDLRSARAGGPATAVAHIAEPNPRTSCRGIFR